VRLGMRHCWAEKFAAGERFDQMWRGIHVSSNAKPKGPGQAREDGFGLETNDVAGHRDLCITAPLTASAQQSPHHQGTDHGRLHLQHRVYCR